MNLTEKHVIHKSENKKLYAKRDNECFLSKNLYNATNYIIKQVYRIHLKIKNHKRLEPWESDLLFEINKGIKEYNQGKEDNKKMQYVDNFNGFVANAYFLSYYMAKDNPDYKAMPHSTAAQICIQNLCANWKSFYRSIKDYNKNPSKYKGRPQPPKYKDKVNGRNAISLTHQQVSKKGKYLKLPKFLSDLKVKTNKENIKMLRYHTTTEDVIIEVIYEVETPEEFAGITVNYMAIDLGVNNLAAMTFSNEYEPVIINGRPLKSINQFYHKEKARLQSEADRNPNAPKVTKRMKSLTKKRNNKINDFMHKASRIVVDYAVKRNIDVIVIGKNKNWKQNADMSKQNNQNFESVPFNTFIQMITYKANMKGIKVIEIEEKYTSGTSCLDNEKPVKKNYNKNRRVYRGLFKSNSGLEINADINGSYQIMKKLVDINIYAVESVTMINIPYKKKPA